MKNLFVVFFTVFLISSCSDEIEGDWDDNIHLSTRMVNFGVAADSTIITTKGEWWWIDSIQLNDSIYRYSNDSIDLLSDAYKLVEKEFILVRKNTKTLFIKMNANKTGTVRRLVIGLEAGDYFDSVTVIQAAQ